MRADMWFYVIQQLKHHYRILAPDAHILHQMYALEDVSHALDDLMEHEDAEQAIVVGISAGGGIAQTFLQMYPERVEHLILSHSTTLQSLAQMKEKLQKIKLFVRLQPLFVVRQMMLQKLAAHTPHASHWGDFTRSYIKEVLSSVDKKILLQTLEASLQSARHFSTHTPSTKDWHGQVLLMTSKDDPHTLHQLPALQRLYPDAHQHIFQQGGHHTSLHFPETYCAALEQFLAQLTPQTISRAA